MSGFFENEHVGLTSGEVKWLAGATETAYQTLLIGKHPKKVKPIIVLTPIGLSNGANAYVQEVVFDESSNYWKWKAGISANGEGSGILTASYLIISMWA